MNAKLKIYLLSYTPIGNAARNVPSFKYLQNVRFTTKCQTTKKVFKSPVFNQNSLVFKQTSQSVWEFQLFQSQTDLLIQMIILDSIKKTQNIISQAQLSKLHESTDQNQVIFYTGKQRIGALNFRIERQKPQQPIENKITSDQTLTLHGLKTIQNKTKAKPQFAKQEEDSENQRYDVQFTPHQTVNNSVVKLARVQDHSYFQIFNGLDQSSIEEREPISMDQSFYLSDAIQSRTRMPNEIQSRTVLNNKQQIQPEEKLNFFEAQHITTSNLIISKQNVSKKHQIKQETKQNDKLKEKETQQKQTTSNNVFSKYRIQKEPSSLQKWLQKLQKFQKEKQKQTSRGPQYECFVSQKYKHKKSKDQQKQSNVSLNLLNLTLDSTVDQSYCLKSLKMKVIDEKNKKSPGEQLFECKFSLMNQNDQSKSKQMKLNKLMAQIPQDKNVEIEICLENQDESDPQEIKISGIFMKEKFIDTDQIPLFDRDQNLFASLSYKAKTIKSVSVQYLSPLNSLTEAQSFQKSKIYQSKDRQKAAKNLIRQRKINKMQRRQGLLDNQSPRKNIDLTHQKPPKQTILNSNVRANIQKDFSREKINLSPDSEPKKRKDSTFSAFQLERSNTDNGPYLIQDKKYENEADRQSKSSRSPSIKELKSKIMKIHEEISQFSGNVSLSVSPHKHYQNGLRLKSTTLADLREQQSQDQEDDDHIGSKFQVSQKAGSEVMFEMPLFSPKKLRTQPDRNVSTGLEETIHHRDHLGNFIIEINAITVVLYEHQKSQEQENGKFIILKSQSGETFITNTLFSNHLNLNWKNKFYQFTSSKIEIGIYEKTGFSSQSQSKLMGRVDVKLVDLMKAIKQNFHRAQIFVNNKPIGIVILIYDIFLEKQFAMNVHEIHEERQNKSEMKRKNRPQKVTSATNQTEYEKYHRRGSEKSTIKVGKQKNRKRAKTLQSHKKNYHLPMIDRSNIPSRKKPYYYEGGKKITIGRAQRFTNTNMAEVVGEL